MSMDFMNAFHDGAQPKQQVDSFDNNDVAFRHANSYSSNNSNIPIKGKSKVMDLFAQVDALHAESDEDNSEEEVMNVANCESPTDDQNSLVGNFDLNYDITGKHSRPDLYDDIKDSSAHL